MFEKSRSLRVLLVDVNVERANASLHALAQRGHRPLLVEHSAQALQLVNERRVDVALIHIGALNAAGEECARALSQVAPGLPLMALASRTEPFEARDMSAFGACLMSPLDVEVFDKAFAFVQQLRSAVLFRRDQQSVGLARTDAGSMHLGR